MCSSSHCRSLPVLHCPRYGSHEHLPCEAERELELFSLEKRRLQEDLIVAFSTWKEAYRKAEERLFIRAYSNRMRGNGFELEEGFRLDIRKKFCSVRTVILRNTGVESPSLEAF